jgi:methenyltetrahydromethanopterin cyclohydrolase
MKKEGNMSCDTERLPTMKIVEDCGVGLEGSTSATRLLRREILGARTLHMSVSRSCITVNTNLSHSPPRNT